MGAVDLGDDVAQIDADAETHAAVLGQGVVERLQRALHRHRAGDRLDDAGELGQHAVAGGVDNTAPVIGDAILENPAVAVQGRHRGVIVLAHQAGIAGHVGAQNGGELALPLGLVQRRLSQVRPHGRSIATAPW